MKISTIAIASLGLALASCGQAEETVDIPAALDGKLVAAQDGSIVEATLTGDPEYYVLYHSASW